MGGSGTSRRLGRRAGWLIAALALVLLDPMPASAGRQRSFYVANPVVGPDVCNVNAACYRLGAFDHFLTLTISDIVFSEVPARLSLYDRNGSLVDRHSFCFDSGVTTIVGFNQMIGAVIWAVRVGDDPVAPASGCRFPAVGSTGFIDFFSS